MTLTNHVFGRWLAGGDSERTSAYIFVMKRYFNRSALVALAMAPVLLVLVACSTNPATGEQSFTAFMSPEREKEIGREEHPKVIKGMGGVYDDVEFGAYVATVGAKLSRHSEMPGIVWTFTVLNNSQVNAFALPGGYVYITRGLLALVSNEAEMAGVLAHEIGHVTARHTAQRYSTTIATSLGIQVLGALGQAAGLSSGLGNIAAVGAQAALQGYSREQELESDKLAVRYLSRAGYSPQSMHSFFKKLRVHQRIEGMEEGDPDRAERSNIMATHPRTAERIEQAIALSADAKPFNVQSHREEDYLARVDGMVFGDDRSQGIIRGRVFVHPEIGIRFEAPEGFKLKNTPAKVVARRDKDAYMVFDMAPEKDLKKASGLKNYVERIWAKNIRLVKVERLSINGLNAVTGAGSIQTRSGKRDVRVVAIQGSDDEVFRLLFISKSGLTNALNIPFRNATYSFRRISPSEAAAVKPYRVKVVTIGPTDTVSSLASAQPISEYRLEWFEALNGIGNDAPLAAGSRVKVVVE